MKNLKHGFTLAEILLCVGIIGVVSAMGLLVSKYTTEKAYNMYYYSGYMNLYNALLEADAQKENQTNQEILDRVAKMFDSDIKTACLTLDDGFVPMKNYLTFLTISRPSPSRPSPSRPSPSRPSPSRPSPSRPSTGSSYGPGSITSGTGNVTPPPGFEYGNPTRDPNPPASNNGNNRDEIKDTIITLPPNNTGNSGGSGNIDWTGGSKPSIGIPEKGDGNSGLLPGGGGSYPSFGGPGGGSGGSGGSDGGSGGSDGGSGGTEPPAFDDVPKPVKGGDKYIQTSNGIKYYYNSENVNYKSYICFTMEVPQAKTRTNNGKASVVLMYTKVDDISYLIPVDTLSDVNLQERRDLLPTYIDDGIVGRADAKGTVRAIAYYNYKQAYCAKTSDHSIDSVISCTGVTGKPSANEGVLRVRDPRKAR